MPVFAFFLGVFCLSSLAFPGTNSFIGEFLVLAGGFSVSKLLVVCAVPGVIAAAAYNLRMLQRLAWGGTHNPDHAGLTDLNLREIVTLAPLLVFVFWIGLHPAPLLHVMHASVQHLLAQVGRRAISRHPDPAYIISLAFLPELVLLAGALGLFVGHAGRIARKARPGRGAGRGARRRRGQRADPGPARRSLQRRLPRRPVLAAAQAGLRLRLRRPRGAGRRPARHPRRGQARVPPFPDPERHRPGHARELRRPHFPGRRARTVLLPALPAGADAPRARGPEEPDGVGHQVHHVRRGGQRPHVLRAELPLRPDRHPQPRRR